MFRVRLDALQSENSKFDATYQDHVIWQLVKYQLWFVFAEFVILLKNWAHFITKINAKQTVQTGFFSTYYEAYTFRFEMAIVVIDDK